MHGLYGFYTVFVSHSTWFGCYISEGMVKGTHGYRALGISWFGPGCEFG